jgi:L,D-transpeptidase catalytic domain/Putative peptidoglycan binding domain
VSQGKHAKHKLRTLTKVALVSFVALTVSAGGITFAAYRYDRNNADRILPGVTIDGVDVSGMTRGEAIAAVTAHADTRLLSNLTVTAAGKSWSVTPGDLGLHVDIDTTVDRALALTDSLGFTSRVWRRFRDQPLNVSLPLSYRTSKAAVHAFVEKVAASVGADPRDAAIDLVKSDLRFVHAHPGRELKTDLATTKLLSAIGSEASSVSLPVAPVQPKVSDKSMGPTIVVRLSQNELYLYEGLKLDRKYPVATAAPGYETPVGTWTIVNKQENPTWYNPAPTTWGAGMPLSIPPGPGNPLGPRALYLNAPGVRIHGTTDTSSIGTYASHGCIRMYIPDVEQLYPLIPIGTKVIII